MSDTLPQTHLVEEAISRDHLVLEQLAQVINWPTQRQRTVDAARGLYRTYPARSPLWAGYQQSRPIENSWLVPT